MYLFFISSFILSLILLLWTSSTLPFRLPYKITLFIVLGLATTYCTPLGFLTELGFLLPRFLLLTLSWLCAISLVLVCTKFFHAIFTILLGLLAFIIKPLHPIFRYSLTSNILSLTILILCVLSGSFAFYEVLKIPRVNYVQLPIKDLAPELENYTITHITDTHVGILYNEKLVNNYVTLINSLQSDLIVHTGDTGDAAPKKISNVLKELQKLHAIDGVYYVFGNHENYQSLAAWRNYYVDNNINYLEDTYVIIKDKLVLSGAAAGVRATAIDYETLFRDAPEDLLRIHLDHFPSRAQESSLYADVQLSGHTHGGTMFFIAPIVAKANNSFVNGLYTVNNMHLYVGTGTGIWSYTPLRLFVPSEITVFTLTKQIKDVISE